MNIGCQHHVNYCSRWQRLSTFKLIRDVYRLHGIQGFYRGVTASYYGISETMIYFVLYERLRLSIGHWRGMTLDEDRRMYDFLVIMMASAVCKSAACCLAYPHGQFNITPVYYTYCICRSNMKFLLLLREGSQQLLFHGESLHIVCVLLMDSLYKQFCDIRHYYMCPANVVAEFMMMMGYKVISKVYGYSSL